MRYTDPGFYPDQLPISFFSQDGAWSQYLPQPVHAVEGSPSPDPKRKKTDSGASDPTKCFLSAFCRAKLVRKELAEISVAMPGCETNGRPCPRTIDPTLCDKSESRCTTREENIKIQAVVQNAGSHASELVRQVLAIKKDTLKAVNANRYIDLVKDIAQQLASEDLAASDLFSIKNSAPRTVGGPAPPSLRSRGAPTSDISRTSVGMSSGPRSPTKQQGSFHALQLVVSKMSDLLPKSSGHPSGLGESLSIATMAQRLASLHLNELEHNPDATDMDRTKAHSALHRADAAVQRLEERQHHLSGMLEELEKRMLKKGYLHANLRSRVLEERSGNLRWKGNVFYYTGVNQHDGESGDDAQVSTYKWNQGELCLLDNLIALFRCKASKARDGPTTDLGTPIELVWLVYLHDLAPQQLTVHSRNKGPTSKRQTVMFEVAIIWKSLFQYRLNIASEQPQCTAQCVEAIMNAISAYSAPSTIDNAADLATDSRPGTPYGYTQIPD